jgi:hypothetical protein
MKFKFKEEKSFEDRLSEALKVKFKYPNRIPVNRNYNQYLT